jgi:hypothetical protein
MGAGTPDPEDTAVQLLRPIVAWSVPQPREQPGVFIHCRCPCGGQVFQVHADERAGFVTLACWADNDCDLPNFVIAAEALTEKQAFDRSPGGVPMMSFCTCLDRMAAKFEVGVLISTQQSQPDRVARIRVGLRCVRCGRAICYGWPCACDLAELLERVPGRASRCT